MSGGDNVVGGGIEKAEVYKEYNIYWFQVEAA